ncbi:tyrosine-type recombinase/integrase [Natronomonas sp. EA1]|uniref:tyrosine-type recombinase/integrase n=1 Tax=Natronomonas sp. EA1 TaxID=3421655 RepID=UPI003EBBA38E
MRDVPDSYAANTPSSTAGEPVVEEPPDSDEMDAPEFRVDWDTSEWETGADVPWTMLPREGLVDAYEAVVVPALREHGEDPTARPSHRWLSDHGFRGLIYALTTYHDTTFARFWNAEFGGRPPAGYDWGLSDDSTVERFQQFLSDRKRGLRWSERTVDAHRYRLARYARAYESLHGDGDLLSPVAVESDTPAHEAIARGRETFAHLDSQVGRTTLGRIFETVDSWYDYLVGRRLAAVNPVKSVDADYRWDDAGDDGPSNPALAPAHVSALVDAAADTRERLLVVALCGFGLRSSEVAALHVSQLALEGETPHIAFEERKNGPGVVNLVYGVDVVEDRLVALSDEEHWNGYLFPSVRSRSGHVTRGTIRDWFAELADRADIPDIGGSSPVPQMGRRFWYDAYTSTMDAVLEHVAEIAEEQGSASPEVVWDNYLSAARKQQLRRRFMRERLAEAFE